MEKKSDKNNVSNPDVLFNIGLYYFSGDGVPQSYEVVYWWRKAVKKDNIDAKNNLGNCYIRGIGVNQSYNKLLIGLKKLLKMEIQTLNLL